MFTLTAFNPNGLNFDTVAHDVESVKNLAKRIMSLGGVDLKLNGKPIPASLLASL